MTSLSILLVVVPGGTEAVGRANSVEGVVRLAMLTMYDDSALS